MQREHASEWWEGYLATDVCARHQSSFISYLDRSFQLIENTIGALPEQLRQRSGCFGASGSPAPAAAISKRSRARHHISRAQRLGLCIGGRIGANAITGYLFCSGMFLHCTEQPLLCRLRSLVSSPQLRRDRIIPNGNPRSVSYIYTNSHRVKSTPIA